MVKWNQPQHMVNMSKMHEDAWSSVTDGVLVVIEGWKEGRSYKSGLYTDWTLIRLC